MLTKPDHFHDSDVDEVMDAAADELKEGDHLTAADLIRAKDAPLRPLVYDALEEHGRTNDIKSDLQTEVVCQTLKSLIAHAENK